MGVGILLAAVVASADNTRLMPMRISSPEFGDGQPIPSTCAKATGNLSPSLQIDAVPANAKSLVLMVDDPDAPSGLWTHWLLWNIAPGTTVIEKGKIPDGAVQGKNSFGNARYDGPAPPSGTHRYFFHAYALNTTLPLGGGASRDDLVSEIKGHVVANAEFYGTYSVDQKSQPSRNLF